MNIVALFRSAYAVALDRPCINTPHGPALSFGDLDNLSAQFAAALREAGLQPGDRVVAQVDKSVGNVALYLGVLRAGGNLRPAQHRVHFK